MYQNLFQNQSIIKVSKHPLWYEHLIMYVEEYRLEEICSILEEYEEKYRILSDDKLFRELVDMLTDVQIKLTEQLLIAIKNKERTIYYSELGNKVTPPVFQRNVGRNIEEVSKVCYNLGLPLISAMVVSKSSKSAESGFYRLYKYLNIDTQGLSEYELFNLELRRIADCNDWYKLADYLKLDIDLPRPKTNKEMARELDMESVQPPQIRILPMSMPLEFEDYSYEDVQCEFFLDKLIIVHKGRYNYRENGMNAPKHSLVLFQFSNRIIASARLIGVEKYNEPDYGIYKGAYIFETNSIHVFEPISVDELQAIGIPIKKFSQAAQVISYDYLDSVMNLIKIKKEQVIPEEIPIELLHTYNEGAKKQIVVNAYERNQKARQDCIRINGAKCVICGFDFGSYYGKEFEGKIHVHHIKPLSEIDENYIVNPKSDLVPICPNCHMVLHTKVDGETYSIDDLKAKLKGK